MKLSKKMVSVMIILGSMIFDVYANPSQQQAAMAQQMAQQNQQSSQQSQRPLSHQGMQGNIIQAQSNTDEDRNDSSDQQNIELAQITNQNGN